MPAGEFRSSCHLPSHCKGAWLGICQLSTSQWAEDKNGFVIPSCKWSLCCVRTAGASARRSKKEPRLLLNIHFSSRSSGRQAGPEPTCGLCYFVTLPGTLNHACTFTGVSCLSQDHQLFSMLILLTLVCEISLALNSFLHQWVPWNAHFRIRGMPKDASLPWGEGEGLKTRVVLSHLQHLPALWSGEQGSLCFPGSLLSSGLGLGLCGHEPGAAVMSLVCVNCDTTQLQSGVAGLGTPLWLQRTGMAFSSPCGQLVAVRTCRRNFRLLSGSQPTGHWAPGLSQEHQAALG